MAKKSALKPKEGNRITFNSGPKLYFGCTDQCYIQRIK